MKKIVWLVIMCFMSAANAGVLDDGKLTAGEYGFSVEIGDKNSLVVDGGGSNSITMNNYSHLEILSTSMPLASGTKGVWSIDLLDNSSLTFSGGATNVIAIRDNSTALITGGQINIIASYQVVNNNNHHITIVCQKDYRLAYENNIPKIMYGNWLDGTPFEINFSNKMNYGYNPVFDNIKIIPEPASMLLLGLGSVLIKKRRRQ